MADKNDKPESSPENGKDLSDKRVYDIKGGVKSNLRPILLTTALLAVTVLAAAVGFTANLGGEGSSNIALPVFLGGVSLLCWFGFTLLAILKRDLSLSKIIMIIFGVSFVAFFALMLSGVGGSRVEMTAMIFGALSLPYFAVYTLLEAVGMSTGGVIFATAIIYAALIAANAWNFIRLRKIAAPAGKPDGGKKGFTLRMFDDGGRREDDKNKW